MVEKSSFQQLTQLNIAYRDDFQSQSGNYNEKLHLLLV